MMLKSLQQKESWGLRWRSSVYFIVATMAVALLTDMYLYGFLIPLLPYILEHRLGLDESLIQRLSTALLSESALIMFVASPLIGSHADRSGAKRAWLLAGLAGALLGSLVIALATSVFILFAGRLIQSLASSSLWVVGFATLADQVPVKDIGKMYGFVTVAIAVGTSGGPVVAGVLFDLGGYWVAWSSVLFIVLFDVVMRCLMIEGLPINEPAQRNSDEEEPEREVLLPLPEASGEERPVAGAEKTGLRFYWCLFSNGRFVGGMVSYLCFAILTASFDATLPLHVRSTFQWGSMPSGLLFAVLQGPGVFFSVPIGWLKDRVGTRHPTTIGFALLIPLLWAIGIPGDERFPWASAGRIGPVMYSAAVCGAGIVICLLNGVGTMEATQAVDEIQSNSPGIFGPNGGYSRAISLVSMSWTAGMFIGPILSGYGVEQIGYYGMNCILAGMCGLCAFVAFWNLRSSVPQRSISA
ncbi:unnamed protein product [Penicillium salamii]|uniref:Major facilitator superfamily (MFS) profile domain-containing protein n=1 Tax=Penicillium salamii TaxID=1612424 RepID=A0A9W4P041_9EURO|nr:unnamed protein product [Penicillium salamii]CAG8245098.1 unnamed protein product [Penicillium salamii]CAG8291944.1 unnamed protein product [Penicillium salamii]CAG8321581.1 unnamed protein product [Penicillium salamii]CAG8401384.1 unnamed protein product [Penicillium salamii]